MSIRSSIRSFDTQVTTWIHQIFPHEQWRGFFGTITVLGDPITIILVTAAIIGVGLYHGSMQLVFSGVAIPVTVSIGAIIKLLVERARPISEYSANLITFSFPSGHSTGSVVAYGLLAYLAFMKLPASLDVVISILLILVPIAVGVSRVQLGAHFPSDVLAGWTLGMVGLLVIIFLIRPL